MDKPAEYREFAAECVKLAAASEIAGDKALLLTIADRWLKLAVLAARAPGSYEAEVRGPAHRAWSRARTV